MKKETTRAFLTGFYDHVFRAGYCDLQNIYRYEEPRFYNHGVYGWNFDVFTDHTENGESVAITTGYRNMTGKLIPYDIIEKYNSKARKILEVPFSTPFEETQKQLEENRRAFIAELMTL